MLLALESPGGGLSSSLSGPRHPVEAATAALVAYFAAAVPGLSAAREDFPEHAQDMDLADGPVLSIDSGLPVYVLCTPGTLDDVPLAGGGLQTMWRVGYWSAAMQVDLFAAYKSVRDDFSWAIDQLFHHGVPRHTGIRVAADSYYGRPIIADYTGTFTEGDTRSSTRGEWRRSWNLDVRGDLVSFGETPSIAQLTLKLTTTLNGLTPADESTIIIP